MIRLCIICGKEAVVGNFCKECFLKKHQLFDIKDFRVLMCTNEDAYYNKGWQEVPGLKTMVHELIKRNLRPKGKIDKIIVSYRPFKDGYDVNVKCIGKIEGIEKEDEKDIHIGVRTKLCDDCVKVSGRYHEAKMQVRGERAEKILNSLASIVPKTSSIEQNKYGFDILFISKNEAASVADKLKKRYKVKKSFKVVGSKKGKMLNRDVYSIK